MNLNNINAGFTSGIVLNPAATEYRKQMQAGVSSNQIFSENPSRFKFILLTYRTKKHTFYE